MTSVRQILRCARRLGQLSESGRKVSNRSVTYMSTQPRQKIIEDENGKKIFPSPHGEITPSDMLLHEHIWKNIGNYADKIALECAVTGRKYTYSEARDASNYVARSLRNMGFTKGDIIALISPNYPETIIGAIGSLEADLTVTTVNPTYTPEEIMRQLKVTSPKVILTVAQIARIAVLAFKDYLPPGVPIIAIEDGTGPIPEGTVPFKDLITRGKTLPPIKNYQMTTHDTAVLPFSSGTTGLPKGVILTHRNLVSNIQMVDQTAAGKMWRDTIGDLQEVSPVFLPFFHIFGMNCCVLPRLAAGTKLITLPNFLPELFLDVLTKHKVTGLFLVPPIVMFLATSPLMKKEHFESMHHFVSGAAPLAEQDVQRFYEKFQINQEKLKFCQGYGLTETSPVICLNIDGKKPGSIGKNIASSEIRLVDPVTNNDIFSPGQTGELWVRGPHVMKGYFGNESATREMITEDGWLKSGDIGYYDEEFDFFLTDRMKELIKVKGFQVAPAELEAVLRTHPAVQEAAVIGVSDQRSGELPKAFVVLKKGATVKAEDIKDFVKNKVTEFKRLEGGVVFVDSIPLTASGKIQRTKLKEYK
ncbi:PREDICTED: 4-coumarate--CoA ligase 1 isoform X1 [Eufriesea mexicana]|uniref:4-coumarate--CoA ligase 1 isoform X1 n=2 Tax=Eufriesea mexicana TaxID=516756 RepID=UPI00083C1AFF|nr:PREDICTED: 4-coumarate--CoA ligase 1 isoform X1 [Eufriesea mexicana]XP_017766806.1 PREDICTED: 4-coumarate--CoA ligase 1 isoform X1 [Eufriesea mexicana]XP_017766807.1 PREDICTED: 4-coumarate--CoA ligase 1 isoform X1 [Eufriesea mexicana]